MNLYLSRPGIGVWVSIIALNAICNPLCYGTENSTDNLLSLQNLLELPLEELVKLSVVTTTRTPLYSRTAPFKVIIISREEIQQQLALTSDTSQVLSNLVPGFSPSQQKLSGRGENLRSRNQLMMVDGIPQTNSLRDSARDSHTIDLELVERIEIIYGANAIQGMGASGGIINFITLAPGKNTATTAMAHLVTDDQFSEDGQGYKLGMQHQTHIDKSWLLLAATWEIRGLYYDGNNRALGLEQIQGDLMDTRTHDILFKAGYNAEQQRIQLTYHDYAINSQGDFINVPGNISQGLLATSAPGQMPGEPPGNKTTFTAMDYNHNDLLGGNLSLKLFHQENYTTFGASVTAILQDPDIGNNLVDQSQIKSDKQGMKLSYSIPELAGQPLDISTGMDYLHDENIQILLMTDRVWSPEMDFESWAPFIDAEYKVTQNVIIRAGLRRESAELVVDDYQTIATSNNTSVMGGKLTFEETLRNIGMVCHITPQWSTSINYGEGFGMPDAGRVLRAVNTPGQSVDDILEVAPVVTKNRELGIKYLNKAIQAQLSYYESSTPYGTLLQPLDGVFSLARERVEISGWELNGHWQATPTSRLGGIYSNSHSRYDANSDNQVDSDLHPMEAAPDRIVLYWSQEWKNNWSTRLQLNHDFSRRFHTQGIQTAEFENYTLVDLSINYHFSESELSLGITNLTDRQYIPYLTQADVLRDDRYFAGRGRSLLLSYRTEF